MPRYRRPQTQVDRDVAAVLLAEVMLSGDSTPESWMRSVGWTREATDQVLDSAVDAFLATLTPEDTPTDMAGFLVLAFFTLGLRLGSVTEKRRRDFLEAERKKAGPSRHRLGGRGRK